MSESNETFRMGWLPDYPSLRDHKADDDVVTPKLKALGQKESIKSLLAKVNAAATPATLAPTADLRAWCSPIENQGALGSCTANAGVCLLYTSRCV